MARRILVALGALLFVGLTIGIPLQFTEAGKSLSDFDGRSVGGWGTFVEPQSGNLVEVGVNAYSYEQTITSPGSGGSQKARSGRTGGPGTTITQTGVDVYAYMYDSFGHYLGSGSGHGVPTTFTVANDLSSAKLVAALDLQVFDANGNPVGLWPVSMDFDLTATGPLQLSRDNFKSHIKSPRESFHSISTDAHRTADATGTVVVQGMSLSVQSEYAEIGAFSSRSMSSY